MCNFSQSSLICRHCCLIFSINVNLWLCLLEHPAQPDIATASANGMGLGAGLSVCLTNGESGNLVLYHKIIQTHNLILSVYRVCAVFMKVKLKLFRNFFGLATDYNAKSIIFFYFCLTQYKFLKNLVAFFTFIAYFTFNHHVPPKQRLFKLLWFTRANLTAFIFCLAIMNILHQSVMRNRHMHVLNISLCWTATSCYGSDFCFIFYIKSINKVSNNTAVETHGLCME